MKSITIKSISIILLILIIDQSVKFWIKTNMHLGEEIKVFGDWFIIHFTENPGMAFGIKFWGGIGKVFLTIFRIVAVIGIGWYLRILIRQKAPTMVVISITFIMAGALGNILDSVFYGLIFDEGTVFDPITQRWIGYWGVANADMSGYASVFKGCVVDMLYFPVLKGNYPSWFPFWANQDFIFFRPVFNIADSAITIGVAYILLFERSFFKHIE